MPRPSRPLLVDALVVAAILALVAALVVLQIVLRPGSDDRTAGSQEHVEGPITHSTLGPTPTPSETASASPPAATSAPPSSSGATVPQPGGQASELASSAQSVAATPSIFRIATFNVLGASHTRKGGDSFIKTPYTKRMSYAVRVLANHGADVVGFQEFEPPQATVFQKMLGATWGMFPSPGSKQADGRQTIAWREETMELVRTATVTYPYFHGQTIRTPAVELRVRGTEDTFWVFNVHNPATGCAVCGGNNDNWRQQAVQREISAIRSLSADGTPVFLVGDMNSKAAFFCAMAAALPVVFANGGSYDSTGCHAPRPTPIDWILATRGVTFTGFLADDSPLVDAASDHPAYSVTAMLP